jgi:hypothetical protein
MAAAIKAINAKIRSNKVLDYICSTRTCNPQRLYLFPKSAARRSYPSHP